MTRHDDTDTTPAGLAATYFRAWLTKDFDTLRSILAADATFRGPLGAAADAGACVQGLRAMAAMTTDIVVQHVFVDR